MPDPWAAADDHPLRCYDCAICERDSALWCEPVPCHPFQKCEPLTDDWGQPVA